MRVMRVLGAMAVVFTVLAFGAAGAINDGILNGGPLGQNITVDDLSHTIRPKDMTGTGVGQEDQEVDYGSLWNQTWDLEGFFFDPLSRVLTGAGGFDFDDGQSGVNAGDIFIDVDGDYSIPGRVPVSPDTQGYDFVIDVDWDAEPETYRYRVVDIRQGATLQGISINPNADGSNPYRYVSGGTLLSLPPGMDVLLDYETNLPGGDAILGLAGVRHNVYQLSLAWLAFDSFTVHQTMTCGNDGLNGTYSMQCNVPDGGATLAMLGVALAGLGVLYRRH